MFRSFVITVLVALSLAGAMLVAHGAPLIGTVTAVGKDSITISDKAGKSIVVGLDKDTKFLKEKKPAAMSDITVGSRVVIDAHQDQTSKKYVAEEVQIGVTATEAKPAAKTPAKKAPPKPKE
jgi:Domain of unknown function (DUF5666)